MQKPNLSHEAESVDLLASDSASALLWLGDRKKAKKVILFFYGGGFILPLSPAQLRWMQDVFVDEAHRNGTNVACAVLDYGLAPDVPQPNQLQQALLALKHLLDLGFESSNIVVGGDSSGANLTMRLLLHLRHPHKYQRIQMPELRLKAPLLGTFLVSPFLSGTLISEKDSGPWADMNSLASAKRLINLNATESEAYNGETVATLLPLDGDLEKFFDINETVSHMYLTFGGVELLADHSVLLAKTLHERCPALDIQITTDPIAPHDGIMLEYFLPWGAGGSCEHTYEEMGTECLPIVVNISLYKR